MASSRNNNTIGNYKTEMIQQDKTRMHVYYTGSVINQTTCYPGDGLLGCRNPNLALANDFIDIETDLLGIGSTNLVNPKKSQQHTFHPFKVLDIQQRCKTFMPEPLIVNKYNRPLLN